ncbi:MAG: hypothetical protein KME06_15555 [Kastovskya adunca ATA6-11-RM4]|jgi:hypothetical protein|nr:hypothetical protein [Kastovskya adunca ATA6-11-RM4]
MAMVIEKNDSLKNPAFKISSIGEERVTRVSSDFKEFSFYRFSLVTLFFLLFIPFC